MFNLFKSISFKPFKFKHDKTLTNWIISWKAKNIRQDLKLKKKVTVSKRNNWKQNVLLQNKKNFI